MRIIFLGTPQIAVPTLEKLIDWPKGEVVAVVTQPDKPKGRGKHLHMPPTKIVAEDFGIPVLQPIKLSKSPETVQAMKDLQPEVLVMVAFGQILKQPVLEMAPYGVVNLHASLLPKLRGPAPINWAIINGESSTGITTMFTDAGVDTGDMLLKREVPIEKDMNAEELGQVLAKAGANLVIETLEHMLVGSLRPEKQDNDQSTHAPMMGKELGIIDWQKPAQSIHNLVRGLVPWPGTSTTFDGKPLKIVKTRLPYRLVDISGQTSKPGEIVNIDDVLTIACGEDGSDRLEIIDVQPANKARMHAKDWANGVHLKPGQVLGQL